MTPWIIQNRLLNVINKISSLTCINFYYKIFSCKHFVWMELDKSQLLYQVHHDYISLAHTGTKDWEQRTVIWRHDNMSDVILRKIAFNLHVFLELSLIWQYLSMRFECYGTQLMEKQSVLWPVLIITLLCILVIFQLQLDCPFKLVFMETYFNG